MNDQQPTSSAHNSFVHCHCNSAFSLSEGALRINRLIALAKQKNMMAVGIADRMNLFGALSFSQTAIAQGIKPLIGCKISLAGSLDSNTDKENNKDSSELILMVQNETGYVNLNRLISKAYLTSEPQDLVAIKSEWLDETSVEGLICIIGGEDAPVQKALLKNADDQADSILTTLSKLFPNRCYIEIQRHQLTWQKQIESALIQLADHLNIPLIASNDCYFEQKEHYEAHSILLCVGDGVTISSPYRRSKTDQHYFKSSEEMEALFSDLPDALANTFELTKRCNFYVKPASPMLPRYPDTITPDDVHMEEGEFLTYKAKEGLKIRLEAMAERAELTPKAQAEFDLPYYDRLEMELGVIIKAGYSGYYLIVYDFIDWALKQQIPVGPGRGSGAGSLVAYCLWITNIDPLKWNLLFERFLNPERVSLPDFDIDFCPDNRDRVIDYVYEKYGKDRVGQIITFGTFQARAAIRDVGRVLEIPYPVTDRLCKLIPFNPASPEPLAVLIKNQPEILKEIREQEEIATLFDIAQKLEGLYRHASTHAGGVVIADRPLSDIVALYRDPRSTMPLTQFSKDDAETAGLVKFDFLGVKTLTIIDRARKLIEQTTGEGTININELPLDDAKTFELLQAANTNAVFQLEGVGVAQWLKQLKPDRLDDIVALTSLYRPGPMENIPTYVECRWQRKTPHYPHPSTEPILKPTYGVAVYQEQVMQITQVLAGFTLGMADKMRKVMGKKKAELLPPLEKEFVEGAKKTHQLPEEESKKIFALLAKFAGYGFNKSHAVAYALIAYQTAWIKAHYPLEFYAANIDQELRAGSIDTLAKIVQDARKNQVKILPADINHSGDKCRLEWDKDKKNRAIRYPLTALKGVSAAAVEQIMECLDQGGAFKDLFDFLERVPAFSGFKRQLEILIQAGAFDGLGVNRRRLFENLDALVLYTGGASEEVRDGNALFGMDMVRENRPKLVDYKDWEPSEKLLREAGMVGFYLTGHPLEGFERGLKRLDVLTYEAVEATFHSNISLDDDYSLAGALLEVRQISYVPKNKKDNDEQAPKKEEKKRFLTVLVLSDTSRQYEVTIRPEKARELGSILTVGRLLLLNVQAYLKTPEKNDDEINNGESVGDPQFEEGQDKPASDIEQQDQMMRLKALTIRDLQGTLAETAEKAEITLFGPKMPFDQLANIIETTTEPGQGRIALRLVPELDGISYECQLQGGYRFTKQFEREVADIIEVSQVEIY